MLLMSSCHKVIPRLTGGLCLFKGPVLLPSWQPFSSFHLSRKADITEVIPFKLHRFCIMWTRKVFGSQNELFIIFRVFFQNFALPGYLSFFIFCAILLISPYFLLVGLLLQHVALFQSRELVHFYCIHYKHMQRCCLQWQVNLMCTLTFLSLSPPGCRGIVITVQVGRWVHDCQTLRNAYLWNRWTDFLPSKFYRNV